jgi:hypothetical protein
MQEDTKAKLFVLLVPTGGATGLILLIFAVGVLLPQSDFDRVKRDVRAAASEAQWRAWARKVILRSSTNSAPIPPSDWPAFVHRLAKPPRHWEVRVMKENDAGPLVCVLSPGGFESVGLIIGPPSYIELAPKGIPQTSQQIYPGIYVRDVH